MSLVLSALMLGGVALLSKFVLKPVAAPEVSAEERDPREVPEHPAEATTEQPVDEPNPITASIIDEDEEKKKNEHENVETEEGVNRSLALSWCGAGLALLGSGFPILGPLSGVIVLYASISLFQRARHAVFDERRLRYVILDSVAVLAGVVGGFYLASAVSSVLYYLGRKLLRKTEDQSLEKLVTIFDGRGRVAWLWKDGVEVEVQVADLEPGDIIIVGAGQVVPIDGIVREGAATIDEHVLTGESRPVEKLPGSQVLAATLVLTGRVRIEVERTGESTVVAQVAAFLNKTADYRAEMESRGERLGDQSVLPILSIAALAAPLVGPRGTVAILSSNFTESLRVAVPLSMLHFLAAAADNSILIKDGRAIELLSAVDMVVFDKTGTLTVETPHIGDIFTCNGMDPETLLMYAAAAETKQSHPIARAIQEEAKNRSLSLPALDDLHYHAGFGIEAFIDDRRVLVGSARFMAMSDVPSLDELQRHETEAHERGHSLIYVAMDGQLAGALELRPTLREEVREVFKALRDRGLTLGIISGDHEAPTKWLAKELGIDNYFAEVLPEDKATLIKQLQEQGHEVCFVGDGINDAIALKVANASISLRGATTVAMDTAQVVLMDGSLRQLPRLFELCSEFKSNARVGMVTTFVPAAACVAGVFFFHFGIYASMMLFNLSLAASVGNAMLPALKRKNMAHHAKRTPGAPGSIKERNQVA